MKTIGFKSISLSLCLSETSSLEKKPSSSSSSSSSWSSSSSLSSILAQEVLSATAVTHLGCGCGNAFPKRYRTDRIPFDSLRPYQGHSLKSRDLGSSRVGFRQDLAIGTHAQQRILRDQWQKKPCYSRKPSCVAASCQQDPS